METSARQVEAKASKIDLFGLVVRQLVGTVPPWTLLHGDMSYFFSTYNTVLTGLILGLFGFVVFPCKCPENGQ